MLATCVVVCCAWGENRPSMFGTIDCLKVRWEARVSVSSLTAICLFHNPMVAVVVFVAVVVVVEQTLASNLLSNTHSDVMHTNPPPQTTPKRGSSF